MSLTRNLSSITSFEQLIEFFTLEGMGEPRNTEFKNGNEWNYLKCQITKALIGLSNLEYGGKVIIGIDENADNPLTGMTEEQSKTFTLDHIKKFVNEYADPPLEIKLHKFNDGKEKYFIVIGVSEFLELPTICKKDGCDGLLQRNKIYFRPMKNTETTDNFTHHDMRELLDLATEKYYIKQMRIYKKFKKLSETFTRQFDDEVTDF